MFVHRNFNPYDGICVFESSKTRMPQKGLKRGLRGAGRKEENFPQKFSSFLPVRTIQLGKNQRAFF
jgi:hypothetical protein